MFDDEQYEYICVCLYSAGWALYLYNGQLRNGSSEGGGNFDKAYSKNTIIRVELDLEARPRTLSFTLSNDRSGTGPAKKAFELPEGAYYPALGLQHFVRGEASVELLFEQHSEADIQWDASWSTGVSNLQISNDRKTVTSAGGMQPIRALQSYSTGKHAWKVHYGRADYLKLAVVKEGASKTKQVGADSLGWALYLNQGKLRHGSSSGGGNFDSKYSVGTTVRVELDLDSRPRTLSFTLANDRSGTGRVKKAFELPEGAYYPALGVQHSASNGNPASVSLLV